MEGFNGSRINELAKKSSYTVHLAGMELSGSSHRLDFWNPLAPVDLPGADLPEPLLESHQLTIENTFFKAWSLCAKETLLCPACRTMPWTLANLSLHWRHLFILLPEGKCPESVCLITFNSIRICFYFAGCPPCPQTKALEKEWLNQYLIALLWEKKGNSSFGGASANWPSLPISVFRKQGCVLAVGREEEMGESFPSDGFQWLEQIKGHSCFTFNWKQPNCKINPGSTCVHDDSIVTGFSESALTFCHTPSPDVPHTVSSARKTRGSARFHQTALSDILLNAASFRMGEFRTSFYFCPSESLL